MSGNNTGNIAHGGSFGPIQIALTHVTNSWFPMGVESGEVIRNRLIKNSYRSSPEILLKDIKQDFALFTHCVRSLVSDSKKKGEPLENIFPVNLLEATDVQQLVSIANKSPHSLSLHGASRGTPAQTKTLVNPIASAVIAEALAPAMGLPRDLAFSCAILRQLGLTLIAWNYPTVFGRALSSSDKEPSLDSALNKRLGFSPSLLGLAIAKEWAIAPLIRVGMGDAALEERLSPEELLSAQSLKKICRIGEALTRAHDPISSARAQKRFDEAVIEAEKLLGDNALKTIRDSLGEHCEYFIGALPRELKPDYVTSIYSAEENSESAEKGKVPAAVLACLKKISSEASKESSDDHTLNMILHELFPLAGFKTGCVYLVAPETLSLVPRLALGSARLNTFSSVQIGSLKPVGQAFKTRAPLLEIKEDLGKEAIGFIVGGLGKSSISGVLYVVPQEDAFPSKDDATACFRIIRTALETSLKW